VPNDPTLGARIRKRRQELRLTQKQLAGKLGVDESSVIHWEKDKHYPARHLGALEAVLGIRLGDPADDMPGPATSEELQAALRLLQDAVLRREDNGRPKAS
jgi:transcriptional regulator with XRE-family HTH domain